MAEISAKEKIAFYDRAKKQAERTDRAV